MALPTISTIIPAWNAARYIKKCLSSLQLQSFPAWEAIVIDDGSTDHTANIVKELGLQDSRIRYAYQPNQGLASARNHGIRLARGTLVQFLDADDQLLPDKFAKQVDFINSNPDTDVIYGDCELVYTETNLHVFREHTLRLGVNPLHDLLYCWPKGISIPIHCALFKKSILRIPICFIEELRAKEDWVFWIDLALQNAQFSYQPGVVALYVQHPENMCKDSSVMRLNEFIAVAHIVQKLPFSEAHKFMEFFLEQETNTVSVQNNFLNPYIKSYWQNIGYRLAHDHKEARVALYGGGKHTDWLLRTVHNVPGPIVVAILDDQPDSLKPKYSIPVIHPTEFKTASADAIVISSDTSAATEMLLSSRRLYSNHLPILWPYEKLPKGPYHKHG